VVAHALSGEFNLLYDLICLFFGGIMSWIPLGWLTLDKIEKVEKALAEQRLPFRLKCTGERKWHTETGEITDVCWLEPLLPYMDPRDLRKLLDTLDELGVLPP